MVTVLTPRGAFPPYRSGFLPDGRFVLRRRLERRHELTSPPGVAVDVQVLDEAERQGCTGIIVERIRTGKVLWAPLSRWRRGISVNCGFGEQRALRWSELECLPSAGSQLSLFDTSPAEIPQ